MDLSIRDISFKNFRNYKHLHISDIGPLTIFTGENATGKTNIIEGIQLLTAITSFRNPLSKQLSLWDSENTHIEASLMSNSRDLLARMEIQDGKKKYFLNGKPKRTHDLKGLLPAVTFSPSDLNLVKGSNTQKRNTLDALGVQLSRNYSVIKNDYEKLIQHKNKLLKETHSIDLIMSINETLLTVGTQLFCYRYSLYKKIEPLFIKYYHNISRKTDSTTISYIPSWVNSESEQEYPSQNFDKNTVLELFSEELERKYQEEKIRKHALVGPHADKIEFFINGKNARIYGSQGQQRSLVLAYKLSEVALMQEILNQQPVLLLDDVMSELDSFRRESLIEYISDDIQTFITTTNLQYFTQDILDKARIISLPLEKERE